MEQIISYQHELIKSLTKDVKLWKDEAVRMRKMIDDLGNIKYNEISIKINTMLPEDYKKIAEDICKITEHLKIENK